MHYLLVAVRRICHGIVYLRYDIHIHVESLYNYWYTGPRCPPPNTAAWLCWTK